MVHGQKMCETWRKVLNNANLDELPKQVMGIEHTNMCTQRKAHVHILDANNKKISTRTCPNDEIKAQMRFIQVHYAVFCCVVMLFGVQYYLFTSFSFVQR